MEQINWIRTKDGRQIAAKCYQPNKKSRQVMLIGSSAIVTQEWYGTFARFMAAHGLVVITFDYRGVGLSRHGKLKNDPAKLQQWALLDLDAVLLHIKNQFPKHEILYLGHGISGEIVGLAPASQFINRLILVNSALSAWRLWPVKYKFRIKSLKLSRLILSLLYGYYPGNAVRFLQDLPKGVVKEWFSWSNLHNGIFDVFPDNNYRKLQVSVLAYSTADDWLAPKSAVKELLQYFSNSDINWHHLNPKELGVQKIRHTGFFDTSLKSNIWINLVEWITSVYKIQKDFTIPG